MRLYEVMVIFDPGLEPDGVRSASEKYGAVLTDRGGLVTRTDVWGRRRFAYEVKHRKDGTYVVVEATATIDAISELDRVLSIADEVLRHKIVRLPDEGISVVVAGVDDGLPDPPPQRSERSGGRDRDER